MSLGDLNIGKLGFIWNLGFGHWNLIPELRCFHHDASDDVCRNVQNKTSFSQNPPDCQGKRSSPLPFDGNP